MRHRPIMDANVPATREVRVLRHVDAQREWAQDQVICERPVALVFNGVSHAVMMATPTDLEDFALGFALSEGLIAHFDDCRDLEIADNTEGLEVRLQISTRAFSEMQARRRGLNGRTGCGLCGVDSLQALRDSHPPPLPTEARQAPIEPERILQAFSRLHEHQALQADTGGCHAAAWANAQGELLAVREDVGRHNALDKLIGHLARAHLLKQRGMVLVSSRASYELVSKCARMGLDTLAAVSAPTSMAIELAQETGVRLYGFCRGDRAVAYTAPTQA